jgi:hypothetical protein
LNYSIKYALKKSPLKPFVRIGVSTGFHLKLSDLVVVKALDFNDIVYEGEITPSPQKIDFGVQGGLGLSFQKFSTEIRFEYNARGSALQNLIKTNTISLLVGYRLAK